MAAQLMAMKGAAARGLTACSARAKHSLPTPLSPLKSTVESVGATLRTRCATALKPPEAPTKPARPGGGVAGFVPGVVAGASDASLRGAARVGTGATTSGARPGEPTKLSMRR
jgi:hypothetical protein